MDRSLLEQPLVTAPAEDYWLADLTSLDNPDAIEVVKARIRAED